jgi:hypothetical protein
VAVPLYVRLLGYKAAGVETTDARDDVRRALEDAEFHTDETLCETLQSALAEHPRLVVWCVTILDGGIVSVFDGDWPRGTLHRATAEIVASTGVSFEAPAGWKAGVSAPRCTGFYTVEVSSVSEALVDAHPSFSDDVEPTEGPATLDFPVFFGSEEDLETVLSLLAPVTTNEVLTFTLIGRSFYMVGLGPSHARATRMLPCGETDDETAIVRSILDGDPPFAENLVRKQTPWLTMFTSDSESQFDKACRSARNAISESLYDEEAKARRRELSEPVTEALRRLAQGDRRRAELWEIASWLRSAKVRALTVESLEGGDPALTDAHIERQRELVMRELPDLVERTYRTKPSTPWLPRVVRILAQLDLAKPEWPR